MVRFFNSRRSTVDLPALDNENQENNMGQMEGRRIKAKKFSFSFSTTIAKIKTFFQEIFDFIKQANKTEPSSKKRDIKEGNGELCFKCCLSLVPLK